MKSTGQFLRNWRLSEKGAYRFLSPNPCMTFNYQAYFDIISGKRTDLFAQLCRVGLSVLEIPYTIVIAIRNFMYDNDLRKINKLGVPVVSVGNLTVGGTGKTPFVAWLAQKYLDEGKFPAIISRGYHADETGWNDEARELRLLLPDVPQAFSKKRFAAAQQILSQYTGENGTKKIDVILLDDGFQHRKLFRNKNILLIDATNPFGYLRVIPRGLLREPLSAMKRADMVILSRADAVDVAEKSRLHDELQRFTQNIVRVEMVFVPTCLLNTSGERHKIETLAGRTVLAFCGLGNPDAFFRTVSACGAKIVETMVFPDHHHYTNTDQIKISDFARQIRVEAVVCSLKDYVKIRDWPKEEINLYAIVVSAKISGNFEIF